MLHRPQPDADDGDEDYWEQQRIEGLASIRMRRIAAKVASFKRNYLAIWVPNFLENTAQVHQPVGGFLGLNSHPRFITPDAYREFRMESYYRVNSWNHQMSWDLDPESRERVVYDCHRVVHRYLNQIRAENGILRNLPPEPLPPRDRTQFMAFLNAV